MRTSASKYLAIVLLLIAPLAHAQTQRSGDANARAMQQLQQLTAERAQLKADNEKLKQEVDNLKKQVTTASSAQTSLQKKLKQAESLADRDVSQSKQHEEATEKLRAQMQELVTRFRETATTLKEVESDRNTTRTALQSKERELAVCVDRNVELYQINTQALDRLEKKGVWSSLTEKEPFTQIQRTRMENLIDDYRARADESRLKSNTKSNSK
jgi:chromosome segregation ATPase